jgi:hypothetical protein
VFARELSARTTTVKRERGEIDLHLIECTALAFAPQHLSILARVLPGFCVSELLACRRGTRVGGQRQCLICGKLYAQSCTLSDQLFGYLVLNSFAVWQKWNAKYNIMTLVAYFWTCIYSSTAIVHNLW